MRVPLCVLLCGVLALQPGPAAAGPVAPGADDAEVRIAVLPPKVQGQVDEATRRGWTAGLRRGVGRGELALLDQDAADTIGDCTRKGCLDRVRAAGATHAVRTTITMKHRDYLLKLELVAAESGVVVLQAEETCEICGVGEVSDLLDAQGALLQSRFAAIGKGPPVLVLDTRPTGALVHVDGEVVGTAPIERQLVPGAHRVRVSLQGYVAEEREWTFVAGGREEAVLELQRTPGNPKRRALGAAAVGGGVALFGAGIALVALDDIEYRPRCHGDEVDADGDCKWLYNTGWGGAVLAVTGAVLLTLGIVALVRNRANRPAKQAHVVPGGLGIIGRF